MGRPRVNGCGTRAGYYYHRLHATPICTPCRTANAVYVTERRRAKVRRQRRGPVSHIVCDYLETYSEATTTQLADRIADRHPDINREQIKDELTRLHHEHRVTVLRTVPNDRPGPHVNVWRLAAGVDWLEVG